MFRPRPRRKRTVCLQASAGSATRTASSSFSLPSLSVKKSNENFIPEMPELAFWGFSFLLKYRKHQRDAPFAFRRKLHVAWRQALGKSGAYGDKIKYRVRPGDWRPREGRSTANNTGLQSNVLPATSYIIAEANEEGNTSPRCSRAGAFHMSCRSPALCSGEGRSP